MTSVNETKEPTISNLEGVVRDYWESIQKAIEIETNRLKEEAERDSSQIIAEAQEEASKTIIRAKQEAKSESERIISGANEEAEKIIAQARQEAKGESERIIASVKEEAGKTVAQARQEAEGESERIIASAKEEAERAARLYRQETYTEALQESARIISDTKEKISQTISAVIERCVTQVRDELVRSASKAETELESETSRILSQVRKNIGEINDDTNIPGEADTSMAPASNEEDSNIPVFEDFLDAGVEEGDDTRLFKGRLKVEIVSPAYKEQDSDIQHVLAQIPGLKVLSTDSYSRGNNQIMAHVIELEQPVSLLKTLKAKIQVKDISEEKGNIILTAK